MKVRWGFDTSALVSLGHSERARMICRYIDLIVSKGILAELEQIAEIGDEDGSSAKGWLELSHLLTIKRVRKCGDGEEEVFRICRDEDIPLVIDDMRAVKRFQKVVQCLFSVHVIYHLYLEGNLSKEEAVLATDRMRIKRDWKNNLISLLARTLYE